jgi:hypothetical protein
MTLRLAVAVAVLAVTAGLAILLYGPGASEEPRPDEVRAAVAARLVAALEQATPAEHQSHGHHDLGALSSVLCTVEVLGLEPSDATDPGRVRRVYANHLCAVSDNGRPWDAAVKTSGPLVAEWGAVPTVELLPPDRVPAEYRALPSTIDGQRLADLRTRFDADVAAFWAALKGPTPTSG